MSSPNIKNINIESDEDSFTPSVRFDINTGVCWLEGESCLENASDFYLDIMNWLKVYTTEVKKPLQLNLKLMYFNTSSSKCILDILKLLRKYKDLGGEVVVNWHYKSYDTDQVEEAEDYIAYTKMPMNIVPFEDDSDSGF